MKKIIINFLLIAFFFFPISSKADIVPIIEGNKDTKIKLIVYESLTCSHCANFHKNIYPDLKEDFINKGLISIEFKSFPLDMAAFNASKIAHCKNDGRSEILHYLYNNQSQWLKGNTVEDANKNIMSLINKSNFNLDFNKCISNKKVEDYILEERIEGVKKFKINSTPTLIIDGEKFENPLNYKKLKNYLEKLI
tara:strand:+ start:827 stop:1408 length:582 start_codon:yes stop_codon:yes gene_type:complete